MRISFNWLKDFIEFEKDLSLQEIAWKLTEATAAIDKVHYLGKGLDQVVVGELLSTKKHPNADHLYVAQVKISSKEKIQVIYGEKANVKIGDKLPTAIAPTELHGGKIEVRELRGEKSEGMLCLDSELIQGAPAVLTKFDKKAKIGTPVADEMMVNDIVFEIDNHAITHRADLFSHLGFARECVALGLAKWKKKSVKKVKTGSKKAIPMKISFENKKISKSYWSTVITGVSPKASPLWMKRRLEAVGIRSINAIVDITNYVMMEVGQPNHAFDLRILEGKDFFMRLSKVGEKVKTLDGVERLLPKEVIIVESDGKIIDLAGIMGGFNSEIKSDTRDIYFHSSHFDNVLIRRAMIALGHRTEGGTMHEKNIEPERSGQGFLRALELFHEVFPEAKFEYKVYSHVHEQSPKKSIQLSFEGLKNLSGLDIASKRAKQILESLSFKVNLKSSSLTALPPPWRAQNTNIPEDVIEEIVRIYGYSNVPALPPQIVLKTPTKNIKLQRKRILQHVLTGLGFQEELNFSFLSEALLKKLHFENSPCVVELKNPVSDDFRFMRPRLLFSLLQNLARNVIVEDKPWKSFEFGHVFSRTESEVEEHEMLTILIRSGEKSSFLEAKGLIEMLLKELSFRASFQESEHGLAHPGRALSFAADSMMLGNIYELHPRFLAAYKVEGSAAVIECDFKALANLQAHEVTYQPINRNPEALLDISVMVEKLTPMKEVENLIRSVDPEKLVKIKLVDLYDGESIEKGKKSLTFSLAYQHPERTLSDKEIQSILERLIHAVESSGAKVRR